MYNNIIFKCACVGIISYINIGVYIGIGNRCIYFTVVCPFGLIISNKIIIVRWKWFFWLCSCLCARIYKTDFVSMRMNDGIMVGAIIMFIWGLVNAQLLRKGLQFNSLKNNKIWKHFKLNQIVEAYDTFGNAATEKALKVILTNE